MYVFGIGSKVKKDELNSLASKKRDEDHLFILQGYNDLLEVFNKIISDKTVTICGVAQEEVEEDSRFHTHPWHVTFSGRTACVEGARQTLSPGTDVTLGEFVPERLLCSGGTKNKQDAITCKGESGGSLFLQKRKRYFQVGVVSWGTHSCTLVSNDSPPPSARDFHIDVFKVTSWLKLYLHKDIQFLPDVN